MPEKMENPKIAGNTRRQQLEMALGPAVSQDLHGILRRSSADWSDAESDYVLNVLFDCLPFKNTIKSLFRRKYFNLTEQDHQDLYQDTFLRCRTSIRKYRGADENNDSVATFQAFVLYQAWACATDFFRRRRRGGIIVDDPEVEETINKQSKQPKSASPDREALGKERLKLYRQFLQCLSEVDQRFLRYMEAEVSVEEVAAIENITKNNVTTRINRARNRFVHILHKNGMKELNLEDFRP